MKRVITQDELQQLVKLEAGIAAAKRSLKRLLEQHEVIDAPITAALLEGAGKIEAGPLTVSLDWHRRRSPDYKAWIDHEHGQGTCEKILAETKPTETPFLVIEKVEEMKA